MPPRLLLASQSPRRRQLIGLTGCDVQTAVSDLDETVLDGETPAQYVTRLAIAKAQACAHLAGPDQIALGSDTAVIDGSDILGKPGSPAEARQMLQRLRGHSHHVYTAIAALRIRDGLLLTDLCITAVPMREYGDEEIEAYVATGDPLDKAGGYAIQHDGFKPVGTLRGCFASVMGLPLCHLTRTLARMDETLDSDVPAGCQRTLEYACPIFAAVLRGESVG